MPLRLHRTLHWWLAFAFLTATLGTDFAHSHGPAETDLTACEAACADQGVHLSGHHSVDTSRHQTDCPGCLHRGLVYDSPSDKLAQGEVVAPWHPTRETPTLRSAALSRPHTRAPPIV